MAFQIDSAMAQRVHCRWGRDALNFGTIGSRVGCRWIEQASVQSSFVAKQQKAFRIQIEPSERIHAGRKPEVRERALAWLVWCELSQDSVGFEKGEQHELRRVTLQSASGQGHPKRRPRQQADEAVSP
jgi:hypothetical protein